MNWKGIHGWEGHLWPRRAFMDGKGIHGLEGHSLTSRAFIDFKDIHGLEGHSQTGRRNYEMTNSTVQHTFYKTLTHGSILCPDIKESNSITSTGCNYVPVWGSGSFLYIDAYDMYCS